jgi:rubrerythrin
MKRGEPFPLDRYLDASRTLSLDSYDWSRARETPLEPEIERVLVYMLRIEAQTLFYVRDLLNTRTAFVPEIASFLAVWLYEEERHSRMFTRFLRERGIEVPAGDRGHVRRAAGAGLREWLEAAGARWMARATEHFVAVHMTWGAYQELSTIHAYERLADRCDHPLLRELCTSIAKDERRHYAFYYNQAQRRLQPPAAQRLTRFLLKGWWKPVGFGVHAGDHVSFMVDFLYGGEDGARLVRRMDETIGRLPGLAGLGLYERAVERARRVVSEGRASGRTFDDWVPVPGRLRMANQRAGSRTPTPARGAA